MNPRITTTISRPVSKVCPFMNEDDYGHVTITFDGDADELHQLANGIEELVGEPISHEDFTRRVIDLFDPDGGVGVVSTWSTAGWTVEVRSA